MCEFSVLLSGHIDQMNTAEEETQLQAHLAQCTHCRELLRQMEAADAALRALPADPPEELTARIMQGVRSQPRKRRFVKRFLPIAAAGAAAVLALVFSGPLAALSSKDAASFELANECSPMQVEPYAAKSGSSADEYSDRSTITLSDSFYAADSVVSTESDLNGAWDSSSPASGSCNLEDVLLSGTESSLRSMHVRSLPLTGFPVAEDPDESSTSGETADALDWLSVWLRSMEHLLLRSTGSAA